MKSFAFSLFAGTLVYLLIVNFNWSKLLFSFSPQGMVDPQNLTYDGYSHELSAIYDNNVIPVPYHFALNNDEQSAVLGESDGGTKRIDVNLTEQRLYAYENGQLKYNFLVSTGKWGRTPTGSFKVWTKLRYTKMSGGSKELGTYYYLPNVPYVMFFYNEKTPKMQGYSIHGTYWHNNFGHPMSHGCINMKTDEAGILFNWADIESTQIVIYGTSPAT